MSSLRPKSSARKLRTKQASLDLVPDEVWAHVLRGCVSFILHHTMCGVLKDKPCDCKPLLVGTGFGIDRVRPTA